MANFDRAEWLERLEETQRLDRPRLQWMIGPEGTTVRRVTNHTVQAEVFLTREEADNLVRTYQECAGHWPKDQ